MTDEPGFVAFGGQADQVAAQLKELFSDGMSLSEALGAALAALSAGGSASSASGGNGDQAGLTAAQLEVAILDRARAHRTFRRLSGVRLEELLVEGRGAGSGPAASGASGASGKPEDAPGDSSAAEAAGDAAGDAEAAKQAAGEADAPETPAPPTGPAAGGGDGIPKPPTAK